MASLRDEYARLMEAAPVPFLCSLEQLLDTKPNDVRHLFAEGEGIFSGGGMHTGVLWALEALSWSPDYLSRVGLILAKLGSLDPGGKLANRPINSLREIFLWWYPGTNAPMVQRLAALDLIMAQVPLVGWALLAELLPEASSSISSPTARPRWRNFGDLPKDMSTRRGQLAYVSAIVDRGLDRVGVDPQRWQAILNSIRVINNEQQKRVIESLSEIAKGETSEDHRAKLWEILRDFVYEHRHFSDTHWALPSDVLDKLDEVLAHLAPGDPIVRNRWLFEEWVPELPSGEKDFESQEQMAEELRRQAVQEIFEKQGMQGLVKLGTTSKYPGCVAQVAVPLFENLVEIRALVEQAVAEGDKGISFASQISGRAQQIYGEAWSGIVRKEARAGAWPPVVTASLMIWWPDTRNTWEDVAVLGGDVKSGYWCRKPVSVLKGSPDDLTYQIEHLIEAGRAAEVLCRIAHRARAVPVPSDVLLRVFDAAYDELMKVQTEKEIYRLGLNSYVMRQFLDQLRKLKDIPRVELARREYKALPVLGSLNARGLAIHEFMAEDPSFFVEVICDVYLPSHRDKGRDKKPTPEEQSRAKMGYRLIEGMELIPGQGEGNQIDETVLLQWINVVRTKATDLDRATVADLKIGEILAHSPVDYTDGGWPHRVVREVIEKLASADIDRGLMIERHTMRGTYRKELYEGGAQERDLAKQYREWAGLSISHWPRMARVLSTIAEGWEEQARREDAMAEQMKLG